MQIKKPLAALYLISGDVPLLTQEIRDAIFSLAKIDGFTEKTTLYSDIDFSFEKLITCTQNQSLFSEKTLIDIRNPQAKWDKETLDFFKHYLHNASGNQCIVITTDKLSAAQQKTAWVSAIKAYGVHIPVWPITMDKLPQWIVTRATQLQLSIPLDLANGLAQFTEGNLLSTQQALQKLAILYPNSVINREKLNAVLVDQARFHIFDLSSAIMHSNAKKSVRILKKLQETGEEPTLVLWAICRTIREHFSAQAKLKRGLQMAAKIDYMIKGAEIGNPWQGLTSLSLFLCK